MSTPTDTEEPECVSCGWFRDVIGMYGEQGPHGLQASLRSHLAEDHGQPVRAA